MKEKETMKKWCSALFWWPWGPSLLVVFTGVSVTVAYAVSEPWWAAVMAGVWFGFLSGLSAWATRKRLKRTGNKG
jgi:hypothetical protein